MVPGRSAPHCHARLVATLVTTLASLGFDLNWLPTTYVVPLSAA